MQRRRQLESLAAEGGRTFEERRRELEQWLARMENRLDRQPLVGQTLDVLETQLREHRLSHAEVGQWKAALDTVTRVGQRLAEELEAQQLAGGQPGHTGSLPHNHSGIAHHQTAEDLHVILDRINQRFQDVSMSIQSRGGQLQGALNSLAQLERAVEHFVAWLCDAESSLEVIEDDARRLPPRDDIHRQLLQRIKHITKGRKK
ncbi:dystrophin-like isoform X2 [Varroa jacobsoni]|uniref:dystrophin-like isoform X2 n=1 Tax=Varroa jacobsoni TaxID=62625 RepID=UPI000BF719B5|nr:dystrophin-like isoform X2 [Varroa jacobsoni]